VESNSNAKNPDENKQNGNLSEQMFRNVTERIIENVADITNNNIRVTAVDSPSSSVYSESASYLSKNLVLGLAFGIDEYSLAIFCKSLLSVSNVR
jgi:hypothetical protein